MKITILALTAFVLATAPLAWAQEEETTPAPTPEAAAPEEPAPPAKDPSVSVTTEKSPAAATSSSPAATKSTSPASPSKASSPAKSTSSAAPTKSAPPAAVMPTKKSTPEATLRDIEDKWEASIMSHDPSVAQAYLGNDFRGVSSKGKIMSKSSLVAEIKKDTDTYTSTKNGKVDVRVFGGQFAVVTGTSTEVGKAKDGKAFKRGYRWTDVWVDRNGKWQCVASQSMLLSK
jgi:ketosteroid isomerase-like protein